MNAIIKKNVARVIPKPKGKRGFSQGIFIPSNPEKCKNTTPVIYRSSYEAKLNRYLDSSPSVLAWVSESVKIPYWSEPDKKMRNYMIDYFVKIIKEDGSIENLGLEIKPDSQTRPPKKSKRKREDVYLKEVYDYQVNQCKWRAAEIFCKSRGITFKIMTEYDLGIKKKKMKDC